MDSFVEIAQPSTLHVVSGNMRGGKTLEFLTRMNLVSYRGIPWQLFKPSADDGRDLCTADQIGSRGLFDATISVDATVINEEEPATILDNLNIEPYGIIGIEEVHFFKKPDALVATVLELRRRGYSILVCGLDRDFRGEPFQPTPTLMAHATTIRKYFAACTFLEDGEPCG